MADVEVENVLGVTDRRRIQSQTDLPGALDNDARYMSVGNLRTRLTAINAGYFTAARLNEMTKNDMVYALRLSDDGAGF